jgi:transcriptional regulator with XRE-family HTH domain
MSGTARTVGEVFAERLRDARERRGLSQEALVERLRELGVHTLSPAALAEIESGGRAASPSIEDALAISAALGVSPLTLMTPVDWADQVAVAPTRIVSARRLRGWIRQEFEALVESRAPKTPREGVSATDYFTSLYAGEPAAPTPAGDAPAATPNEATRATEYFISLYAGEPPPPPPPAPAPEDEQD